MPKNTDLIEGPVACIPGLGGFPDDVYVIHVEGSRYAANSITLPDGSTHNGLACFPTPDDASTYKELPNNRGLSGSTKEKPFEQARMLAKTKPQIDCLILFVEGRIVDYHFVK